MNQNGLYQYLRFLCHINEGWLGEHSFSRHGLLSGIWSFAGMVAGRTKNIRIGTAVVVLPLHNPILIAEEAAMLDVISGGRLNLGIGSGYQRQEFDGMLLAGLEALGIRGVEVAAGGGPPAGAAAPQAPGPPGGVGPPPARPPACDGRRTGSQAWP